MKRTLLTAIFLLSAVSGIWALAFEGTVLSPVAGSWENTQPLIIEKPADCEVYYSLTGADPLISGFAYDGPIMLDGQGEQKLRIVSVSENGISDIVSIDFISKNRPSPSYIPQTARDMYIRVTDNTHITMPDTVLWAAGVSANQADPASSAFHTGGEISLNGRCDIPRILPLIISTAQGYYRYLMRVGLDAQSLPAPVPAYEGIEFSQWNYIRFNNGRTTLYSLDGSPWQQTSKPVYVDRSEEHTISWKELKPVTRAELEAGFEEEPAVQTMVLAAKPEFSLPESTWTSQAVLVSFPSEDFTLSYETEGGHIHYASSFGLATVPGDSNGTTTHLTIYYKGIKQGTMDVSVLLNRRIPSGPTVISSAEGGFSRSDVILSFHSSDTVWCKVSIPANRPYGFDFATDDIEALAESASSAASDDFTMLTDGRVVLAVNPDAALLYHLSCYSEDIAGNRSDVSNYTVVVDGANLYAADENTVTDAAFLKTAPLGSMNNPYSTLSEAINASVSEGFMNPRIFVYGTHNLDETLTITKNVRLTGKMNARIICSENAEIDIIGGSASFSGVTIEKRETADIGDFRKCLINMTGASLSLYDSELYTDFKTNGIVIKADDSAINIKKCGITARAASYTALVSSHDTKLFMYNVRGIANAPTAVGISAEGGMSFLADSNLSVIGSLGRIAEYVNLQWVCEACNLQGNNTIPVESAVWTDSASVLLSDKANTFSGFAILWVKADN